MRVNAVLGVMRRPTPPVVDPPARRVHDERVPDRVLAVLDPAAAVRAQLIEGSPVMACACGAGLRWSQMRRPRRLRPEIPGSAFRVDPICCERCAERQP